MVVFFLNGSCKLKCNFHFFIIKCKRHYRSCVLRQIMEKMMVSGMAVGDASNITPVQSKHVFMLCCSTQIMESVILFSVRVLLVTWCVLIN